MILFAQGGLRLKHITSIQQFTRLIAEVALKNVKKLLEYAIVFACRPIRYPVLDAGKRSDSSKLLIHRISCQILPIGHLIFAYVDGYNSM